LASFVRHESNAAPSDSPSRLNKTNRLDEPIVRDTLDASELAPGKRLAYCRCWQSKKFPFCDGAHKAHNEATGDNLGPLIVAMPKN